VDVVGLAADEDVADLLAREEGRGRAPHFARGDAVAARRSEIDRDLRLGDVGVQIDVSVDDALDPREDLLDLIRLLDRSVSRSDPKTRTTIVSEAPVRTSLIRSRRYVSRSR
jgi:hypothetical protein